MRFVELATIVILYLHPNEQWIMRFVDVILYLYPCVALQRFMRFVELATIVILYLYPSVAKVHEIC